MFKAKTCPTCHGSGEIPLPPRKIFWFTWNRKGTCPQCNGQGSIFIDLDPSRKFDSGGRNVDTDSDSLRMALGRRCYAPDDDLLGAALEAPTVHDFSPLSEPTDADYLAAVQVYDPAPSAPEVPQFEARGGEFGGAGATGGWDTPTSEPVAAESATVAETNDYSDPPSDSSSF